MSGVVASSVLMAALSVLGQPAAPLDVGFGKAEITPDVKGKPPVWIAGYGNNRRATGVHDPLFVRALVLRAGGAKIAIACVDVVGLQRPTVLRIRGQLADFRYVLVSSSHNHEGPDVIGLWGPSPLETGVDKNYLKGIEQETVAAIRAAETSAVPAAASYGAARSEFLLRDSRLPIVYDDVLRALLFKQPGSGKPAGIVVQWNCHPESMESKNTLITADFPAATIAQLEKRFGCPVVYLTGTVGGLMTVPGKRLKNEKGQLLDGGTWDLTRVYGEAVATLAEAALAHAEPIALAPFRVSTKEVCLPLVNPGYRALRFVGVLSRDGYGWTGDPYKRGELLPSQTQDRDVAIQTEVAYLRLGQLHVAGIPGEIYPELVYGKYQDPVDPGADFPNAPLEPPVMQSLPGPKTLLIGLANDEVGYIIPKRQWDAKPPFCYGRKSSQYGESNSVGPDVAPILMRALVDCVKAAPQASH